MISSGDQSSQLFGGDGNDTLLIQIGRNTAHVLTGGAGADTFDFSAPVAGRSSRSVITDYTQGIDMLVVAGAQIDLRDLPSGMRLTNGGDGLLLHLTDTDTILFRGLGGDDLL
jgi:Ca2+-binding RTX toxin-like protein